MKSQYSEAGFTLPSTLMVVAILMVLILTVVAVSQLEVKSAAYFRNTTQAKLAAWSGVKLAENLMMNLKSNSFDYNQIVTDNTSTQDVNSGSEGVILPIDNLVFDNVQLQVRIYDEASFCNLNYAGRDELAALPNMSIELADTILDWRDADDEIREYGAESDWYTQLSPSYPAKNEFFDTIDELCIVKGFTSPMLIGTSGNPGLRDYVTVWSQSPNLSPTNQSKFNLKTATSSTIQNQLGAKLDKTEIQALIDYIKTKSFTSLGQLFEIPGFSRTQIAKIIDEVTVNPKPVIPGLVNVNTAGAEVLSALPGSTPEIANAIIEARKSQGPFHNLADVINADSIPDDAIAKFIDRIVVGSTRFRVIVDATSGKANLRLMAVIDINGAKPQLIYSTFWTIPTAIGGN